MNHKRLLVLGTMLLAGIGLAAVQPGFDAKETVRHVRSGRSGPSADSRGPLALTGEFLIDTSITLVGAPGDQDDPAIALDGANFLVTWTDERSGSSDICAARVTPQGTVLDPNGILVSTAAGGWSPAIAFDGTNFLVTWMDYRSGSSYDIYAARVTPQGTVLDPNGIPVSTAAYDQWSPALAFDGANFLVTWMDYRSGSSYDVYAARVTPQGTVLDPNGIPVSTAAYDQGSPAIAFDGANFLVTWANYRSGSSYDVYAARVTPQGTVLDPNGIPVSTAADDQWCPAIAFDGANFLVTWMDYRSGSSDIYAARVTPQGTVLDPNGIPVSTAADDQWYPALVFDGASFLVTWADLRSGSSRDIYAARVTPQGTVLDPNGIPVSTATNQQWSPAIAFDGADFLVTWMDYRRGSYWDIYAARVTPQGTVLDPNGIPVSTAANWQEYPAIAFDGANFLVTWMDCRSGGSWDIYAARVTPQGTVLDPNGIPVSTAANWQEYPALAFDGANFLVTWQDDRSGGSWDIYAARVTPQGTVLDPNGIPVSADANRQEYPALAFDGANFLVTWTDSRGSSDGIYAARVTPQGTVLDPNGIPVSIATDDQEYPALAFDGANFLVTWEDWRSGSYSDIYAARVTPQGTVLDPNGIPVSTAAYDQWYPALAFDGANFLVTWEDWRSGSSFDIYAARVTPQGTVLDPNGIPVSTAGDFQESPAVAFDGTNFLVTWEDYRSGTSYDIYAARVTPAGVVFDTGPAVRQEGDQLYPALARGTGNQMFLVYQGWAGTVGGKTYNTDRIWGKFGPFPGVEETTNGEVRTTNRLPTIVRGVLNLPLAALLDITGRKVLKLQAGPNDVSRLAPGVYFIRESPPQAQRVAMLARIVVTK
jgi:NADH:ubiquinone oxidoreductase subunit